MGETKPNVLRPSFNGSLAIEGRPEQMTANAGLLLLREVDDRLGFTAALSAELEDSRDPSRTRHTAAELLRSRLLLQAAGYDQQRDIAHLADDPAFAASISDRRGAGCVDRRPASQPTLARFQRMLGSPANLARLQAGVFDLARRSIRALGKPEDEGLTIDIDSTPIDAYGQQPGSAYNGHYRRRCFHPLVATLAETNHILGGRLRPGNESTSQDALSFLLPLIERTHEEVGPVKWIRGDAGFANNDFLEAVENLDALEDRQIKYVLRARNNKKLNEIAEEYLKPPKGPKPKEQREWHVDLTYSSVRWPRERRLILVIQQREDSMYLHHFFLVTNCWESCPEWLMQHYRNRGSMEGRLGDFKGAFDPALACTTQSDDEDSRAEAFGASASTFQLCLMADGLLHTLRSLAGAELSADKEGQPSLRRVRRLVVGVAARMTRSARRLTFLVGTRIRELWGKLNERLDRLLPTA